MPEDELVGTTLDGRYRISDLLGRGGMGAVYVADHVGLGRRVAIKFLLATDSTDADARARFQREARAAGKVVHEHVVHVFDVGYAAGRDYIAMEYVDGIDLERVLAAGPLPVARALTITRQLLAGVGAIHAAGFVHRDIKPANIVLAARDDGSDFVKIMDFGVAKTLKAGDDTVTSSGKVVGTLAYMAPEQLTGGTVDHRADLYAVGLTLYMMLTGELPSTAFTRVAEAQRGERPTDLASRIAGLPPIAATALEHALDPDPARRFATARDFLGALDGGPITTRDTAATAVGRASAPVVGTRASDAAAPYANAPTGVLGATGLADARPHARESAAGVTLAARGLGSGSVRPAERPPTPATSPDPAAVRRRSWLPLALGAVAIMTVAAIIGFVATRPKERTATAATPPAPSTAPADAGVDHVARGRDAELAGKFQVAIAEYEEALASNGPGELLYRLGELSERLGRRDEAAVYFERYVAARPDAPDRTLVTSRIAALRGTASSRDAGVATSSTSAKPVKPAAPAKPARSAATPDQSAAAQAPSHPPYTGAIGTRCNCTSVDKQAALCAARTAQPTCTCEHPDNRQMLCKFPLHGDDSRDCVDTQREECLVAAPPDGCAAWLSKPGARDGEPCRGFNDQVEIDGVYTCTFCETIWFGVITNRADAAGKPCRGWHPSTGALADGVLRYCR